VTQISLPELHAVFLDTVSKCLNGLRQQDDEDIAYSLFEEFDVGAHSILHDDNLASFRMLTSSMMKWLQ
jgi:hypothetical protein